MAFLIACIQLIDWTQMITKKIRRNMNINCTEGLVSRMDFFEEWARRKEGDDLNSFVLHSLNLKKEDIQMEPIDRTVCACASKIKVRWEKANRSRDYFLSKNSKWLAGNFSFTIVKIVESRPVAGRPTTSFAGSSEKTKKRKISHLLVHSPEKLAYAAHLKFHASGSRMTSRRIKDVLSPNPPKDATPSARQLLPNEALALLLDCRWTKDSYILARNKAIEAGHNLYPPYYKLQQAKRECCVSIDKILIGESRAELSLQDLLDLTTRRLCEVQLSVLRQLIETSETNEFILLSKWGCGGSGGHSKYKQAFYSSLASDENLFMFSLVPLRLSQSSNARDDEAAVWKNSVPGSTRYCRPIKFMFHKESTSLIKTETDLIRGQIASLTPTVFFVDGKAIYITHKLLLTMLDVKAINALTDTKSTQACFICQATSNQLKTKKQEPNIIEEHYSYGLSTLHAWIRCYEFFLNLSYKMDIKKKIIKSDTDKATRDLKKVQVQKLFKEKLGLNVDQPKPGFGNTNDGNSARKFFKNTGVSASITRVDQGLINRFRVILQVLSSGQEIDVPSFEKYAQETKRELETLYPWYDMSPTVHKLLEHSSQIIKYHLVPIGQLTEEAQESRNKDCRRFREHHTRKNSRENANRDLLTILLVSSDPVIASFRGPPRKKTEQLDSEITALLKCSMPAAQLLNLSLESKEGEEDDINQANTDSDFSDDEDDGDSGFVMTDEYYND